MKLKITLATATAMGVLMGAAGAADNNSAYIDQSGSTNNALILQSGSGNHAGDNSAKNRIQQTGDNNDLKITQSGSSARVGTGGNFGSQNLGVDQLGDYNRLEILQTGSGSVNTVQQNSQGATAVPSGVVNEAIVKQLNGNGSTLVSRIDQTYTGNATTDAKNLVTIDQNATGTGPRVGGGGSTGDQSGGVFQTGFANTIDIDQIGRYDRTNEVRQSGSENSFTVLQQYSNTGGFNGNEFTLGTQTGIANVASLTHAGARNFTALVQQDNSAGGSVGNDAVVSLTGDSNGFGGLSRAAAAAGASSSSVVQLGDENDVSYIVTGNDNQYGFYQDGTLNKATNIVVNGSGNELGVYQEGTNNSLSLATISDDDNIIGLVQKGTDNVASISVSGGQNVGYDDFGSGPAGNLASTQGLTAGLLEQYGTFNQVSLTVSGGSNNVFASLQNNRDYGASSTQNVITATQTGSDNQAAVVQLGNNNVASLAQTGGANSVSVQQ